MPFASAVSDLPLRVQSSALNVPGSLQYLAQCKLVPSVFVLDAASSQNHLLYLLVYQIFFDAG